MLQIRISGTLGRVKRIAVFLLVTIAALAASSCTRGPKPRAPGGPLVVHLPGEPVTLDPSLAEDGVSLRILNNIMQGLVAYDGEGKLVAGLAESYEFQNSGRTLVFRLRPGTLWSDGVPVQPDDFVYALKRALAPGTPSKLAEMLMPIQGAREFRSGKARDLGVRVKDRTLILTLSRPDPTILGALTLPVALPLRRDWMEKTGGRWTPEHPVTGPYKISGHQPGQKYELTSNEKFWGSRPSIAAVTLRVIADESTALSLFESDQIDILNRIPSYDFKRLKAKGWIHAFPFFATYYLGFNTKKPPFDDRNMRRAVAGALSRTQITALLDAGETPARSWVPPGLEGYLGTAEPTVFADSLARVKGRLDKLPKVTLAFDSSQRNQMLMERVQSEVQQILGLKIELNNWDWKTHVKAVTSDAPQIFRFGWMAPFSDPISHLEMLMTGNPNNHTGWSNPQYDAWVRKIRSLPPGPSREALVEQAQTLAIDEQAVVIPVYHLVTVIAHKPGLSGVRANPYGVILFGEMKRP